MVTTERRGEDDCVANRSREPSGPLYVVIEPKKPPRFMTVEEVARSFGVSDKSPLCAALFTEEAMTAVQAVACLGRSIHVGVARQLLRMLRAEGLLPSGLLYGSAFSGIDTFAAAVDEELEGDWTYSFASERDETARRGLAMAWAARGLQDNMIYRDARAAEAAGGPRVDLYVTTPTCEKSSRRNLQSSEERDGAALDARRGVGQPTLRTREEATGSGDGERVGARGYRSEDRATVTARGIQEEDCAAGPAHYRGRANGKREAVLGPRGRG